MDSGSVIIWIIRLGGVLIFSLLLYVIWRSELAHRAIETERAARLASERRWGRDRQRERGD